MPRLDTFGIFNGTVNRPKELTATGNPNWFGESKTGTPFIALPLTVTEGSQAGHEITAFLYLSDKAFDSTIARLKEVFGFNGDLMGLNSGQHTFEGMPVSFETDIEEYEGKQKCKVKWLNAPGGGGGGIKAPEPAKLAALLKALTPKGKAIAKTVAMAAGNLTPPPTPKAAPAAAAQPATPDNDDEVPF
jgi:hypothetical protein